VKSVNPLICPFTLAAEETMAWCLLLLGEATLLHPFPLKVPAWCDRLISEGKLKILVPPRSPEEIRQKDRRLREIRAFGQEHPDRGFLEYLKGATARTGDESLDEIRSLLRGHRSGPLEQSKESGPTEGEVLLCLIHDWLMNQWEIEATLERIEEKEQRLIQGWEEGLEESISIRSNEPLTVKDREREIICPEALKTWWDLKDRLAPEPAGLLTDQRWVWSDYYGVECEAYSESGIILPDMVDVTSETFWERYAAWNAEGVLAPIRKSLQLLLANRVTADREPAIQDLQSALKNLGLQPGSAQKIILPPTESHQEPLLLLSDKMR
jgi:hypothetical protein